MILRILAIVFAAVISGEAFSFTCYLTLAKDSCWTNYDVKVAVIDTYTNKQLAVVEVPKGKSWTRQAFACQPAQKLIYHATFQPHFWKSEMGKVYVALRYWSLPDTIGKGETAWNIPICYPADFAAVPLPPDAIGDCHCDMKSIPPIKPQ